MQELTSQGLSGRAVAWRISTYISSASREFGSDSGGPSGSAGVPHSHPVGLSGKSRPASRQRACVVDGGLLKLKQEIFCSAYLRHSEISWDARFSMGLLLQQGLFLDLWLCRSPGDRNRPDRLGDQTGTSGKQSAGSLQTEGSSRAVHRFRYPAAVSRRFPAANSNHMFGHRQAISPFSPGDLDLNPLPATFRWPRPAQGHHDLHPIRSGLQ